MEKILFKYYQEERSFYACIITISFYSYVKIIKNVKCTRFCRHSLYRSRSECARPQFHVALMRFANFAANTSISANESENFPRFE